MLQQYQKRRNDIIHIYDKDISSIIIAYDECCDFIRDKDNENKIKRILWALHYRHTSSSQCYKMYPTYFRYFNPFTALETIRNMREELKELKTKMKILDLESINHDKKHLWRICDIIFNGDDWEYCSDRIMDRSSECSDRIRYLKGFIL